MIDSLGGRKAIITLVMLVVGMVIVAIKGDVPNNLLTLMMFLTGAYIAGNVGVAGANAITAVKGAPSPAEAQKTAEVTTNMADIEKKIQAVANRQKLAEDSLTKVGTVLNQVLATGQNMGSGNG